MKKTDGGPADPGPAVENALDLFLSELSGRSPLTRAEERELGLRIRAGDEAAVATLCERNLRFVVAVAKRYQHHGLDLGDLIAEGNCGLLAAARKFDPARGVKFITYARFWICQSIQMAIGEQGAAIRLPSDVAGRRRSLWCRARALEQILGREPTIAEIASEVGGDVAAVGRLLAPDRIQSIDAPLADADGQTLADVLGDVADAPDAGVVEGERRELLDEALAALAPREAAILRSYFGLDGDVPRTLAQLGRTCRISRERVRQLRDQAIDRIRAGQHAEALRKSIA